MNTHDGAADTTLIEKCRQGDEEAFRQLYQRYRLPLYSYLNRLLNRDAATADDLFQQTWINAVRNLDAYTEKQRFLSWLFRIAHNLAIDHFRRRAGIRTEEVPERLPSPETPPWERLDRETLAETLEKAIDTLPPEQREVVALRRRGLSFKEIAAIQKTGVNTVLGRMHYAVKKLRKQMKHCLAEP